MNSLKRFIAGPVARGSIAAILIRVIGLALGFVQAILTARLLGPAGYGVVALVIAVTTVFATFAMMGSGPYSTREIARLKTLGDSAAERGFIQRTLIIVLATSILFPLTLLAVRFANVSVSGTEVLSFIHLAAMLLPMFALALLLQGMHGGLGYVKWSLLPFNVVRPLILVLFLATFYFTDQAMSPHAYLWGALLATAVGVFLYGVRLKRHFKSFASGMAKPPLISSWIGGAVPFLLIGLLDMMIGHTGTFMLAWWSSAEETGLFQPVIRIMPVLMLASQAIDARFTPRISEFHATGQISRLRSLTGKATLASTIFTLLSALLLLCFGGWILGLFGADFKAIESAFWWIAGAQVFSAVTGPSLQILTMSGNGKNAAVPQLAGLATMIGVGAWQIPEGGAVAAAQAIAVGLVVVHSLAHRAAYLKVGIDTSILNSFRQRKIQRALDGS